jgi:hypothetical protein
LFHLIFHKTTASPSPTGGRTQPLRSEGRMRVREKFQPRRDIPHPTRPRRATFSREREKDAPLLLWLSNTPGANPSPTGGRRWLREAESDEGPPDNNAPPFSREREKDTPLLLWLSNTPGSPPFSHWWENAASRSEVG